MRRVPHESVERTADRRIASGMDENYSLVGEVTVHRDDRKEMEEYVTSGDLTSNQIDVRTAGADGHWDHADIALLCMLRDEQAMEIERLRLKLATIVDLTTPCQCAPCERIREEATL